MNDWERGIFVRTIEMFGVRHQQQKLLEEMAELQKEICKHWDGAENYDEIAEEMADVLICMDQMQLIFGNGGAVQSWKMRKERRLLGEIEREDRQCQT